MKPTAKQLAYLRSLATRTGTTFTSPATAAAASAEITRLRTLPTSSAGDALREHRDIQRALRERPDDATAIRAHDIRGYGSNARWAHRPTDTQEHQP
jgi:hypothetical protein